MSLRDPVYFVRHCVASTFQHVLRWTVEQRITQYKRTKCRVQPSLAQHVFSTKMKTTHTGETEERPAKRLKTSNNDGEEPEAKNESETENSSPLGNISDYKCQLCRSARAKYRCPACAIRMSAVYFLLTRPVTCSLACCKEHKTKFECNGKRSKSEFVEVPEMTDDTLCKDYLFLDEVIQRQDVRSYFSERWLFCLVLPCC